MKLQLIPIKKLKLTRMVVDLVACAYDTSFNILNFKYMFSLMMIYVYDSRINILFGVMTNWRQCTLRKA